MTPRRRALALITPVLGVLLIALPARAVSDEPFAAAEVGVDQLLSDPASYTTDPVVVRGELVGDFGQRNDGTVWAQLNGDPYVDAPILGGGSLAGPNLGIGVRIPRELWPGFDAPGGYRVRGPVVALTGWWRYRDPDRGGESYLDVTGLELITPPAGLEEGPGWLPLGLGLGLLGAAAALGWRRRVGR